MSKPSSLTFTGVDNYTNITNLADLLSDHPGMTEVGFLVSKKRLNMEPNMVKRYPNIADLMNTWDVMDLDKAGAAIAVHVCGKWAKQIASMGDLYTIGTVEEQEEGEAVKELIKCATRVQLNLPSIPTNMDPLINFAEWYNVSVILQTRDGFPPFVHDDIYFLADGSGGKGVYDPSTFFDHPGGHDYVGYAGGINPTNINKVIKELAPHVEDYHYWLDMETGLRDAEDCFSIDKVKKVLKKVYG